MVPGDLAVITTASSLGLLLTGASFEKQFVPFNWYFEIAMRRM